MTFQSQRKEKGKFIPQRVVCLGVTTYLYKQWKSCRKPGGFWTPFAEMEKIIEKSVKWTASITGPGVNT